MKLLVKILFVLECLFSIGLAEDSAWLQRNSLAGAQQAYTYYKSAYQQNPDYLHSWKFARAAHFYAYNFLTEYTPRVAIYNEGAAAAQQAINLKPDSPEAHFWLASCYGSIVEASGLLEGYRYVGDILRELDTVIRLAPKFSDGIVYAIRAKVYFKAPGWPLSVGDMNKSAEDFSQAFRYAAGKNRMVYRFYAEFLLQKGERDKAQKIIAQGLALLLDSGDIVEDKKEIALLKVLQK